MGEESAVQLLCGYIKAVQYFFEKVKYHGAIRQGASLARLVGSFAIKKAAEKSDSLFVAEIGLEPTTPRV